MTESQSPFDQHALEKLEYRQVIAHLAGKSLTPFGREAIDSLAPSTDLAWISLRQQEVSEQYDLLRFGSSFPLTRIEDCREEIALSRNTGARLDPEEILLVAELLRAVGALVAYDKESREKAPHIDKYLRELRSAPELLKEIERIIDPATKEVRDGASPELRRIRSDMSETKRRLIRKLEQQLASGRKQAGFQDDVVTVRNGRYVIPVLSSNFKADLGILHDRSQTGSTLYVEPPEAVEGNNKLHALSQQERLEIDRILRMVTSEIGLRADQLLENCRIIGHLDLLHAAALQAKEFGATRPRLLDSPTLRLVQARHPLLIKQFGSVDRVVPLTIALSDDRRVILITGPNTGGKTIALKTVGLLLLMTQSGLLIPASDKSEIGLFRQVFADIGDEQSIEQSLSTFSAHTKHIISALSQADRDTLVLFDEIGAGTDPKEGAALAQAVILAMEERGARVIATTHYSQLKTLALEHEAIENASLEFDQETLAPTYRVHIGIPGSSYAVEIARRLGMPDAICAHASQLVGSSERSLAELIATLQSELQQLRLDKGALQERLAAASALEEKYRVQIDALSRSVDEERERQLAETTALLESTRRETERLVAEIRTSQADQASVKALHQELRDREADVAHQRKKTTAQKPARTTVFRAGDQVRLIHLDQTGRIESLIGKERAKVLVGKLSLQVELRQLEPVGTVSPPPPRSRSSVARVEAESLGSAEIHLRGMTVEEAITELERFLDRAVLSGLRQVYVVHGKGTGTLRRTLTDYLKKHPDIESLRLGDWNEGGAGVTIVKLRA